MASHGETGARVLSLPLREDLVGVAAELARSVRAAGAALSLDPARFAAGTVASPGLPRAIAEAMQAGGRSLAPPAAGEQVILDFAASPDHAAHAALLAAAGIVQAVRVPLKGPGGVIGAAEIYYRQPVVLDEIERTRLRLHAEHAAMTVVNVRLFSLVERAKKEWEGTFDAIRDGISIHDRDCRIRRANWGLGQMLDTTPSLLVGRPCHEAIFGRTSPCSGCPLMPFGKEPSFKARDVEDVIGGRPVHVSMYPLVLEDGGISGMVHIVRDVSEKVREEAEFRRMHEELVRAHGVLQDSLEQLKAAQAQVVQSEKMAAVGQLISGVAHELNNPLTGIIGYSQLLGDGDEPASIPPDKLGRFVRNMGKEAMRCQRIVQNLLTFARKSEAEKRAVDLNEVVGRTVDLKAYELRVNDIELVLELAQRLTPTLGDQYQLQQVLFNLVHNAAQAIKQGRGKGRITIRTREQTEPRATARPFHAARTWLALEVQDDGPGFTEEVRRRMFDPFFTTKEVGQGTGLGLSICYGIVTDHQGYVTAERPAEGGALFRVELPVIEPATKRPAPVREDLPVRAAAPGRRVLVVDDEATICDMVRDVLMFDGYVVETARNGEAGLRAFEAQAFDCVLVDLKMPGIDGPTLHARLSARDAALASRMIFMTGDMLSESSRAFLEGCGCPYLSKPFAIQELRAAVAHVAAGAPAAP